MFSAALLEGPRDLLAEVDLVQASGGAVPLVEEVAIVDVRVGSHLRADAVHVAVPGGDLTLPQKFIKRVARFRLFAW